MATSLRRAPLNWTRILARRRKGTMTKKAPKMNLPGRTLLVPLECTKLPLFGTMNEDTSFSKVFRSSLKCPRKINPSRAFST